MNYAHNEKPKTTGLSASGIASLRFHFLSAYSGIPNPSKMSNHQLTGRYMTHSNIRRANLLMLLFCYGSTYHIFIGRCIGCFANEIPSFFAKIRGMGSCCLRFGVSVSIRGSDYLHHAVFNEFEVSPGSRVVCVDYFISLFPEWG